MSNTDSDGAWYIAISRGSNKRVLIRAYEPTADRYSDLFVLMLGPMSQAAAEWGIRHSDKWITVRELRNKVGSRTLEQVRSGL